MKTLNITAVARYENVRALCHAIKDGHSFTGAGRLLWETIPDRKVMLIPTPGHDGHSVQTATLMCHVDMFASANKGRGPYPCREVWCAPFVFGPRRESLYDRKRRWEDVRGTDLGLYVRSGVDIKGEILKAKAQGFHPYILDTVVDTGTTARAMAELTGIDDVLCIGITDNFKQ